MFIIANNINNIKNIMTIILVNINLILSVIHLFLIEKNGKFEVF